MVSVCLGSMMLYLAFSANNSLVVDDYYKEGKAYNLRIERDRLASVLGLNADITQTSEGLLLDLNQQIPADLPRSLLSDANAAQSTFAMPDALRMRWVHVTQEQRDGEALLQFIGANRFIAPGATLPEQGKYRIHLEPASPPIASQSPNLTVEPLPTSPEGGIGGTPLPDSWRLIGELMGFDRQQTIMVAAPRPEKVFTSTMLE